MRILNVVWGPFPDIRVAKTGRILGEAGHTVDILCLSASGEAWPWGKVIVAPLPQNIALRAVHRLAFIARRDPTVFPWRFRTALQAVVAAGGYDAIHWNDLPGLIDARGIADRARASLIFDMHENYPDNMWSTARDLGSHSWLYDLNAWTDYEARAIRVADQIVVNIEEMGQRLIGMHGIDHARISPVRNAELPETWRGHPPDPELARRFDGKLVLMFISSCSRHRGMDVIIRALPDVLAQAPHVETVIVGEGNGIPLWKSLAAELGVADHVHFEGKVPFRRALDYFHAGHIGLIPHQKYAQTDNGIPHKYAQNLMVGVPLLVSSCHALERLTRELDCGLVFPAGDAAGASARLLDLIDGERRQRLGENGRKAAWDGVMSWARMRDDLLGAYDRALRRAPRVVA